MKLSLGFVARWSAVLIVVAVCSAVLISRNAVSQNVGGDEKKHVTITASLAPGEKAGQSLLVVKATIEKGWHIYSTSQQPGGPVPTKIKLDDSAQYKIAGPISYTPKPEVHHYDFWPKLDVEEHTGSVTWQIPVEVAPEAAVAGIVDLQMCDADRCIPTKIPFSTASR